MLRAAFIMTLVAGVAFAQQGVSVPPGPQIDTSTLATKSDLAASMSANQTKQPSIPSSGPGQGLCRLTVVPSELITSGGMSGAPGTCSRIVQCGTSSSFVVTQFNIGGGC